MGKIYFESVVVSDAGKRRGNNEDNFYFCGTINRKAENIYKYEDKKRNEYLWAVFDGMGGLQNGERASLLAAECLSGFENDFCSNIEQFVVKANRLTCDEITNSGCEMGSTFVGLATKNNQITVSNVGDSRAYLFRKGNLVQLSKDHSQAQRMRDHGLESGDKLISQNSEHILTQYLGIEEEEMILEPYIVSSIEYKAGDIFILCSDGLYDMLSDEKIASILRTGDDIREMSKKMLEYALEAGGKDNVTFILAKAVETGLFGIRKR